MMSSDTMRVVNVEGAGRAEGSASRGNRRPETEFCGTLDRAGDARRTRKPSRGQGEGVRSENLQPIEMERNARGARCVRCAGSGG